jgi:hypothetical protein
MRVLLYVSDDKLKTISDQPHWYDRLDPRLGGSVSFVTASVGLRAREPATLLKMVNQAERKITKEKAARLLTDAASGRPPQLFSFQGPAGHLAEQGVYWVAGASDGIGFVLAGSADNAVATPIKEPGFTLSPSADPVGTIGHVFESKSASDANVARRIRYCWDKVLSAGAGGIEAAPWVSGVAVYADRIPIEATPAVGSSLPSITCLIVGSPLWVEQIDAA